MPMSCTTNLIRTCSLPMETEEEWSKRKELQTLRRLETRRKRFENQQRNMKATKKRETTSLIAAFVDGNNSNQVEAALNEFSSLERTTSLSTSMFNSLTSGDDNNIIYHVGSSFSNPFKYVNISDYATRY
ncbi:hypothetical protein Ahy_B08g093909 [Arachis hypogaea]|uniref:Ninja-family protein n=1 Tax=Arachis hypogaea TaxID=3818 RepID=A0A444Y7K4_ARAHY|nr:hypothetical protein Ahy_B08g093909 [Arachis hypogaea]